MGVLSPWFSSTKAPAESGPEETLHEVASFSKPRFRFLVAERDTSKSVCGGGELPLPETLGFVPEASLNGPLQEPPASGASLEGSSLC